jgi:CheY-like chemotaxis protein
MDCNMPIMDGFQATEILKKKMKVGQVKRAPIIAMTANISLADREECISSGMDYFLSKPFSKIELMNQIKACNIGKQIWRSKT